MNEMFFEVDGFLKHIMWLLQLEKNEINFFI